VASAKAAGDASFWDGYDAWNEAIAEVFFDGRHAHRPVYLDLEPEVLAEAASLAGAEAEDPLADLTAAVKKTLYLTALGPQLFDRHTQRAMAWIIEGRKSPPPFLALLAFLSSIAEEMRSDERFAANNYYGRLCQRLELEPDGADRDRVARCFRAETALFWRELNAWLDANDGGLGLPTAYALDPHLKYVTVPISQALVREHDRQLLPDLFARYRLAPGTRLSRSDMLRFLEDWLPQAPISNALKMLCQQPAARERVADVACIELEMWDGTLLTAEGAVDLDAAISLVAAFHRHPRPRIRFDLVVRGAAPLPEGPYRLVADAPPHACAALAETRGHLTLGRLEPEGWRALEESSSVSIADFLLANVHLERGEASLTHEPRGLIILERDEELMRYVEVPRAHLTREYLLLARARLREPLEVILSSSARPGYRLMAAGEINGLSEGWVAVSDVELVGLPETTSADLASLVPVSWTAISLVSGFALPARATWLRGALPEVVATAIAARSELALSLACEHLLDYEGDPIPLREVSRFSEHAVVKLSDLDLLEGDYRLAITSPFGDGTLASTALHVRSSATPRVLLADQAQPVGHVLDEDRRGALTAAELLAWPNGKIVVAGARTPDRMPELSAEIGHVPTSLGIPTDPEEALDEYEPPVEARAGEGPVCIETGAHYIVLPPAGPERPPPGTTIEGTCKLCGLEKWFPARPGGRPSRRGQPRRHAAQGHRVIPTRRPIVDVAPIETDRPTSLDMLLEALSYAQRGRWSMFEALASQVVDSALFAREAARQLSSLGHVDLVLDHRLVRPEAWAIAPTTIALLASERAALCGQRSIPLIERLGQGAEALGGELVIEEGLDSPALVSVRGLGPDDLVDLAADASSALSCDVRVVEDPALRIAALLPPLSSIVPQLLPFTLPVDAPLERFDVATGRWVEASLVDRPGAYRYRGLLTRYGFARESGAQLLETDARLCKWLAAARERLALLAYDGPSRALVCPLGAEPPGLYERALVLCSGRPPVRRKDGTTLYTEVPPEIAATLWRLLAS
jgi:hypothetical protein